MRIMDPGGPVTGPVPLVGAGDALPTLAQMYQVHRLGLVRLAVLLVDDLPLAEDVVQDAFAAVHARWDRLRDQHSALAYLRVSVVNGARSALRRAAIRPRRLQDGGESARADAAALGHDREVGPGGAVVV